MSNKHAVRNFALGVLAALAIVSTVPPMLANASGLRDWAVAHGYNGPQAFTTGGPLVIPAAAFRSDGLRPGGYTFWFPFGYMQGSTGDCVMAPAYLPQGAVIFEMFASVYDNDAANNVTVNLRRLNRDTGAVDLIGSLNTTGTSTAIQTPYDSTIMNPVVSYPYYAYYVSTCLETSNTRLYSVRIWYYSDFTYLPLTTK
jgi:hypothetical protein